MNLKNSFFNLCYEAMKVIDDVITNVCTLSVDNIGYRNFNL